MDRSNNEVISGIKVKIYTYIIWIISLVLCLIVILAIALLKRSRFSIGGCAVK